MRSKILLIALGLTLLLLPEVGGASGRDGAGSALVEPDPPPAGPEAGEISVLELAAPAYEELWRRLEEEDGFSRRELAELFTGVTVNPRVLELLDTQWEAQPYYRYVAPFLTWWNVGNGRALIARHRELLDRIEAEFGVEREVVVAVWGLESNYGRNQGGFNIFRTLNTIFAAYPRRSAFYGEQLREFLLLCRENQLDPRSVMGSYGGAFGQAQFIPSSFRAYAVDFDGDGRRDIRESVPDILASIANYLRHFGWQLGAPRYAELGDSLNDPALEELRRAGRQGVLPRAELAAIQGVELPEVAEDRPLRLVGLAQADGGWRYLAAYPNFQALTHWNNSYRYAMAVLELAEKFSAR